MSEFAEQCVLGAALLDSRDAMTIVDALAPEMFQNDLHRRMFAVLSDAYWKGEHLDAVTILRHFPDQKEYVVQLVDTAAVYTRYGDYIQAVQEDWQGEKLANALGTLQLQGGTVADTVERLEALCAQHRDLLESRHNGGPDSFTAAASRFVEWMQTRQDDSVKSGFANLDGTTGGFLPGSVFTLAARPGGGKTDFALNLAMRAAKGGARVLYFSMEMTNLQLMQRVAARLLGINGVRIRDRTLTDAEISSLTKLVDSVRKMDRLSFLDEPHISPAKLLHYVELYRPQLVVVDHIGLMKRPEMRDQYKALGLVSNQLKRMALQKNLAVLQLAQMNRQVENRKGGRPNLSDLRESGDLEQDSDFVGFLSPQLGDGQVLLGQEAAEVFLYLEKNRHGRTGKLTFRWRPQYHEYMEVEGRYG